MLWNRDNEEIDPVGFTVFGYGIINQNNSLHILNSRMEQVCGQ
jgi:hypothetical protein